MCPACWRRTIPGGSSCLGPKPSPARSWPRTVLAELPWSLRGCSSVVELQSAEDAGGALNSSPQLFLGELYSMPVVSLGLDDPVQVFLGPGRVVVRHRGPHLTSASARPRVAPGSARRTMPPNTSP